MHEVNRMFVTPFMINRESFSGKMSSMGYKTGPDMCFLVFTGCQGSVTFKFDPRSPEEALGKLQNVKSMVDAFEQALHRQIEEK